MENKNKIISLSISGMHCASCAGIIERSLKKTPEVIQANVNFASQKAQITVDEKAEITASLITAVEKAGYTATLVDKADTEAEKKKRLLEIKHYQQYFLTGLILSLPLLYFMLLDFFPFLPGKMMMPFIGLISFFLATPVQFFIGKDLRADFLTLSSSFCTILALPEGMGY